MIPGRARELMAQDPHEWAAFRPDIVGSVAVGHEGRITELLQHVWA